MGSMNAYIIKGKCIITISMSLLMIAIGLILLKDLSNSNYNYKISYEYINIKDMATASVATKKISDAKINTMINPTTAYTPPQEVSLPTLNNTVPTLEEPKQIWHLPVEYGIITSNPNYSHVALDITSSRGSNENIYPVANGTISGIYQDSAGANIVTIHHVIDGVNYTSQYVHLSAYAPDLYVGKPVTINDCIGKMGTTGISTGVHLHLAVIDCTLFDPNDYYCSDLNKFFSYASTRYTQGFTGLGSLMSVPGSWNSR